jgi:hypothetical protein
VESELATVIDLIQLKHRAARPKYSSYRVVTVAPIHENGYLIHFRVAVFVGIVQKVMLWW